MGKKPKQHKKKLSKAQRTEKRIEHANAYLQGFRMGYAARDKELQMQNERKSETP